jgi:zinc transport system substrate-binding protein
MKMIMKRFARVLLLCLLTRAANAADKLVVYTVNYTLQYFAQRIAADHAEVIFPAPPDVDPAFWMPDTETIQAYQQADLVLLNGAGYARWVKKASLPRLRQVNTSAAFEHAYIPVQKGVTHSHGPAGDHSHSGTAFTTWLDLYQAVQQAEAVLHALVKRRPEHKATFEENFETLREQLMALDLKIQKLVAGGPQQPILASHPVYHYLARRYMLHLEDMQWEPDSMPEEAEWQRLRLVTERFPAQWMIWEKRPLSEISERLDAMGIATLVFDPTANRPPQGDFLEVMQQNVGNLSRAY